ncbi:DNA polymerase III subunit delta' [Moellerella wisconsensis]|nr:DNA polymerase III subunit delta' [Moellerella wisconsensis]
MAAAKLLETTHWQQRQQFCHALSAALQQQDMLSLLPALNQEGDDNSTLLVDGVTH